jgi:hypothetical protein
MSRFVGTIRNISTMRRMLDLHLFDDGLLVADVGLGQSVRHMADQTVRAVAGAPGGPTDVAIDRDAFVRDHPSSRWIPWTTVTSVDLKRTWFGVSRLQLHRLDDSTEKFEWKRLQNDPRTVDALLEAAVPSDLRRP